MRALGLCPRAAVRAGSMLQLGQQLQQQGPRLSPPGRTGRRPGRAPRAQAGPDQQSPLEKLINGFSVAVTKSPANQVKVAIAKLQAGSYDEAEQALKLQGLINSNKVVVFSWTRCPFCKTAKKLLADLGADFSPVELDTMGKEGSVYRAELAKLTGRTSMPSVWVDGECYGGCNDGPGILAMHKQGRLVPLLQGAGAMG